jgi:hypothetical protein
VSSVVKKVTNTYKDIVGEDTDEEKAAKAAETQSKAASAQAAQFASDVQSSVAAATAGLDEATLRARADSDRAAIDEANAKAKESSDRATQTALKNEAAAKKRNLDAQADIVAKRNEQSEADTKRMRRRTTRQTAFSGSSGALGEAQTAKRSAFSTTLGS